MKTTLTTLQAFKAMRRLLEDYYYHTSSDDVGLLLSCTQLFEEGGTYDPALWQDWIAAVGDQSSLTILQAYEAMQKFLESYSNLTSSEDLKKLLESMRLMPHGGTYNPEIWEKWLLAIDEIVNNKV